MEEMIYYDEAKSKIVEFIKNNFSTFPTKLINQFLDFFYTLNNYEEEGIKIRPNILFTNNLNFILNKYANSYKLRLFEDKSEIDFNMRMKSLIPFCTKDYVIYIQVKENELLYGVCKIFNSIKERNLYNDIMETDILSDIDDKCMGFFVKTVNKFTIAFNSLTKNELIVNYTFDNRKLGKVEDEIQEFVNASFSKLRTTQKKKNEIKLLYNNIFRNVIQDVNGAICVVVDKEYIDSGFLGDGIWLEQPIPFKNLFMQSKSYNENKLTAIADLFQTMLNYDGITVVDNAGRIRAYNVFVEPTKVGSTIIGGARKRAAYSIINSRRKKIIGVYFQSHDGEIFYKSVRK